MTSRGYSFSTPEYLGPEVDSYWNDTSNYLWDSPHPDDQYSGNLEENAAQDTMAAAIARRASAAQVAAARQSGTTDNRTLVQKPVQIPQGTTSAPSTASEDSSHSSSSGPSARHGRKASSTSSPTALAGPSVKRRDDTPPGMVKMEDVYEEDDDTFQLDDSAFPSVGMGMDNLSLNTGASAAASPTFKYATTAVSPDPLNAGLFTDRNEGYSPRNYSAMRTFQPSNASPVSSNCLDLMKTRLILHKAADSPAVQDVLR